MAVVAAWAVSFVLDGVVEGSGVCVVPWMVFLVCSGVCVVLVVVSAVYSEVCVVLLVVVAAYLGGSDDGAGVLDGEVVDVG